MKIQFKVQHYQTAAVDAVIDCFAGQPYQDAFSYKIDPGTVQSAEFNQGALSLAAAEPDSAEHGFRNQPIQLTPAQLLSNIHKVQKQANLFQSKGLQTFTTSAGKPMPSSYKPGAALNIDIEMETGTGKTYCYIKTIFEMNQQFGWSKFIIMVPSIAIREGVQKSLQITAEHFAEQYHKKARFFTYNSKRLHELESFSSDSGINIMVMNIQAFNASGADNRRIYDELDDFQSRRPIDVISANRPILILDEPQKMEGKATLEALPRFEPLFILRYSATHKTTHNLVHRLDAVDAYNNKLVKKIAVRGIHTRGIAGTSAYLYLQDIEISKHSPVARLEMQVQLKTGVIKRQVKRISQGDNLFDLSGGLDAYSDRYVVAQIDALADTIEFTNGVVLTAGDVLGDVSEEQLRRIQIRETVNAHLEKEKRLFAQGIKVLSLFFIDEVAKYRDYSQDDEKGEYARIFEEEYQAARDAYLHELAFDNDAYREYLRNISAESTHNGYFSIDKRKSQLVDPKVAKATGLSDDVDAYDLIMKDKERLLSFEEPTRFIFSHSALREGWDNPNVFVLCMLKQTESASTISRRQEVGRGLRIAVNKSGERMDSPEQVHQINVLTVVANESYSSFVDGLQKEMLEELSARPRKANEDYFKGKVIAIDGGQQEMTELQAKQIYRYLIKNDYVDEEDNLTDVYHEDRTNGTLAALPEELQPLAEPIQGLIASVFTNEALPKVQDDRAAKTNNRNEVNFHKKEFQALWARINRKAVYRVDFDSAELVKKAVAQLDAKLNVTLLQYGVQTGVQKDTFTGEDLGRGATFQQQENRKTDENKPIISTVKYDLLGKIAENTELTRATVAQILSQISSKKFYQFQQNPEHFISEVSRIIKEQKATTVIEHLAYNLTDETYSDSEIFTATQAGQDFSNATEKLSKHVYDYVIADSKVEHKFAQALDISAEVAVYAKLPRGFLIPTPVGDYNPDWAIAFTEGSVKHIYFVAETKGSLTSMDLRSLEQSKIECARKFFIELAEKQNDPSIKYEVVDNYESLLDLVS
ncbi:type III restriction-modification system endonuclease [Thiopseudomonas acetoxidans]|uniref:DEAD/DEAH box helicase family protein n=1 Tax=Thiopseudomonas acetoxidans TaxID=3041622 RepID=A0ABT7SNX4_9GAMM|nr:DEAD/DEAH box helicase family protein [Thiopseudomonas sp. CY1220]MDM7857892.1 DEAD/DEAH box helicase family protein [Thiopseudomonas sp. CY1220]